MRKILYIGKIGPFPNFHAKLKPGETVVDLGTGTGDLYLLAYPNVQPGGKVIGADISANMLSIARERLSRDLNCEPDLRLLSAECTGLESESVDVVMMGWSLRNIGDRPKVYREILRILRPGGRFVCIETSQPDFVLTRWSNAIYVRFVMPNLAFLCGGNREGYLYLTGSAEHFPRPAALADEWGQAGFRNTKSKPLMFGAIAIHQGWK